MYNVILTCLAMESRHQLLASLTQEMLQYRSSHDSSTDDAEENADDMMFILPTYSSARDLINKAKTFDIHYQIYKHERSTPIPGR